ncbi:MAG TPA: ISNCY family transposase [Candidatus Deferrimicrobiaceae bacterium]|nr:ISNCY family transposase [Candidatus Deferrimicrobiaceae bacterium]
MMSRKEVPRAGLVQAALAGKITNQEGARALHLSVRQFKRLKARVRRQGLRGLVHGRRGQPSPRRVPAALRAQVVQLMTTTYTGFNDVHLTEKLQQGHALSVSRSPVRRIRRALGRAPPRPRRAPKHRSRRPRAPAMGQLVQLDASPFAWLEDRGPTATLHGLIDDATSTPLALWFRPTEDLHGYTTVRGHTCRRYGVPVTLYGDRLSLFRRNDQAWTLAEELRGQQDPTPFGRMLQDLGIGFIAAQSPQAKGRIERLWGTLQDRLVSELRHRGLTTLEQANAFLPEFLPTFIRRFAQAPAAPLAAWRPAPRDLDRLLSCRYTRVVARDNTVRLGARWVQIPPGPRGRSYAGCRVEVRELLDGRLVVVYQDTLLAVQPTPAPPFVLRPRSAPTRDRQRAEHQRRARGRQLQAAVAALAQTLRPLRPPAPAASPPSPPPRERRGGAQARDRREGRDRGTPQTGRKAVPRRTPPPATSHPWRTTFSPRQRRVNAANPG